MDKKFRFAIMGAGNIANKFCSAVKLLENCEVTAVSSKSLERAEQFAKKNGLAAAYGDYQEMLEKEKPDCVYIAVLPNDHYRLTMLCLDHQVPVLCEKAMFMNGQEAETVFARARQQQVFVMEATWSRFLPAMKQAKAWVREGKIGPLCYMETAIGFRAPQDENNRYLNAALGGGAARDVTIYGYELTRLIADRPILDIQVQTIWGKTGIDLTEHVSLRYENMLASITTSFATGIEEKMVIYGETGKIVIPKPHVAMEAMLYNAAGELAVHYEDRETKNGFTYEIQETMDCIRAGKIESEVVPHSLTLDCARLFDQIADTCRCM